MAKKTTALVPLFHKNITKLVFLCPNMGQKCFKVLRNRLIKAIDEAECVAFIEMFSIKGVLQLLY